LKFNRENSRLLLIGSLEKSLETCYWAGEDSMVISVVICTRNRAESLRATLESLFSTSGLRAADWEALVVDNDSGDRTGEICREFEQRFPDHFRFITERQVGKSNALNTGIFAAKGNVLAFTDDDVLFAPGYIEAIRSIFNTDSVDAAQGRVLLDCEGGWPDWLDERYAGMAAFRDCGDEVVELKGTLFGVNMVVRADVFQKVGGFAPELGPGGIGVYEDTEISLRMRRAGCRMIYAPQILVRHQWSRDRLTKSFIRRRMFLHGRVYAYTEPLPVSLSRFGLYVVKETIVQEFRAVWHLCLGRPALALRCQCEARTHAGLFWQHWLFRRGVPRQWSITPVPAVKAGGPVWK
jgi:glycosyltransferase involved in cell wall biosynthesis